MLKRIIPALLFTLAVWTAAAASNGFEEALDAYKKGDLKKAVTKLKIHIKENPRAEAYYLLGYANYKLGRHEEARKYFEEAYLIDPELKPGEIIPGK